MAATAETIRRCYPDVDELIAQPKAVILTNGVLAFQNLHNPFLNDGGHGTTTDISDFDILYLQRMLNVKYQILSRTVIDKHKLPRVPANTGISANNDTSTNNKLGTASNNTPDATDSNDIFSTDNISITNDMRDANYIHATNHIFTTNDIPASTDINHPLDVTAAAPASDNKAQTNDPGTSTKFSITKVQIKPGKTIDPNQEDSAIYYLSRLPVLKERAAPYVPMPYSFRVSASCNRIKIQNMWGRCPPFHLLFDHTIAVLWLLFSPKDYNCPLGISQLQWALAFLKTIHTRQGDHPKDVQICIDLIENILLDQYADLAKDLTGITKLDQTVHYIDGALGSQSMVVKAIPFSLNYEEMINKCPATVGSKDSKLSMTSAEAKDELENIKKAAGVQSIENLDTVSKHRAINVLKAWKTDQLEKIRGELRRLRSIEDKMKDIDDNFEGYLEDDLEMLYPQ